MKTAQGWGWAVALLATIMMGALGCSSGNGGGGLGVGSLEGTWFGSGDDASGTLGTISITFDDSGEFSGDTTIGPAFAGTATHESGQVFSFLLSDFSEGGFITDESATHAGFVDDAFTFGVVEKGATGLSTYSESDAIGSWEGIEIETDLETFTTASSTVTVNPSGFFSGSSGGSPFSGTISAYSSSYGVYRFSGSNDSGSVFGQAYVSPDKVFMASWICLAFGNFPNDCSFTAWTKD